MHNLPKAEAVFAGPRHDLLIIDAVGIGDACPYWVLKCGVWAAEVGAFTILLFFILFFFFGLVHDLGCDDVAVFIQRAPNLYGVPLFDA